MKVSMMKANGMLIPIGETSIEDFKTLENQEYVIDIKQNRNVAYHRLFFALIKTIFDSQEYYDNFDLFRKYLIMRAGYFDTLVTLKGSTIFMPQSISFESMNQEDFEKLYQAIITFAVKNYGQDESTLNHIMSFT